MLKPYQFVRVAVFIGLFFACGTLLAENAIPAWMTRSAVRICSERREGSDLIVGHGTAFGVNLSKYGYLEPRYLLSAGHNVRDPEGNFYSAVRIETREGDVYRWNSCRVLATDPVLDICLLESSVDIPAIARLAEKDSNIGSELVLIGSPRGTTPAPYRGCLTEKGYGARELTEFQVAQFDHGCSGGPVFDAATERVIGVAVAGVGHGDVMDPNIGLFTPLDGVNRFLQSKLIPRALPQVAVLAPSRVEGVAPSRVEGVRAYGSFLEPASNTVPARSVARIRDGVFLDPNRAKSTATASGTKRTPASGMPVLPALTEAQKAAVAARKKAQAAKIVNAEVVNVDPQPHKTATAAKAKKPAPPKDKPVKAAPAPASGSPIPEPRITAASDETGVIFAP